MFGATTVSEGIITILMYVLSEPWTCDRPASVSVWHTGITVVCQHIWLFTISSLDILILCIAIALLLLFVWMLWGCECIDICAHACGVPKTTIQSLFSPTIGSEDQT